MTILAGDTGNGATIVFGTSGFVAHFTQIGESVQDLGKLDVSYLGTTGEKNYIPDDLSEPGEIECELIWDQRVAPPALGAVELVTITLPKLDPDAGAAATFVGSGFISSRVGTPVCKNGQVMVGKVKFQFDGYGTPTAYTPETAASSS